MSRPSRPARSRRAVWRSNWPTLAVVCALAGDRARSLRTLRLWSRPGRDPISDTATRSVAGGPIPAVRRPENVSISASARTLDCPAEQDAADAHRIRPRVHTPPRLRVPAPFDCRWIPTAHENVVTIGDLQSQAQPPVGVASAAGRSQGGWQAEQSASAQRIPKSVPVPATPATQRREDQDPDSAARRTQARNPSHVVRRMSEHTGRQALLRPRPFGRTALCRSLSSLPVSSEPDAPKPETIGLPR